MLLAPMVRGRKGEHSEALASIRKAGLLRARINGEVVDVEEPPELSRQKVHHIEAVVDRVVIREGLRPRLAESVRLALRHGDGLLVASFEDKPPAARAGKTGSLARNMPAPTASSASRNWNPARSASIALTARVRRAKGWGSARRSIRN